MRRKDSEDMVMEELLDLVRVEFQNLKALVTETFVVHCDTWLYDLIFDLLDLVVEDLDWSGILELLNSAAIERLNVSAKRTCRSMLQCQGSVPEGTVRVADDGTEEKSRISGIEIREEAVQCRKAR